MNRLELHALTEAARVLRRHDLIGPARWLDDIVRTETPQTAVEALVDP